MYKVVLRFSYSVNYERNSPFKSVTEIGGVKHGYRNHD
jgi:hypothetical protein